MNPTIKHKIFAITWESLSTDYTELAVVQIDIPITNQLGFNLDIEEIKSNLFKEIAKTIKEIETKNCLKIKVTSVSLIHEQ